MAGGNVIAEDDIELQSRIFDIQRLKKVKEESFADFLNDINKRDIFSSPESEITEEVAPPKKVKRRPKLNMVYRGNLQMEGSQVAMIEVIRNGVKKSYFGKEGEFVEGFRIVDIHREFVVIYNKQKGKKKLPFSNKY